MAHSMTSELQAFIDHFRNEEELRSAIEGLLSKREEFVGVRNLHGKDEYGKDLLCAGGIGPTEAERMRGEARENHRLGFRPQQRRTERADSVQSGPRHCGSEHARPGRVGQPSLCYVPPNELSATAMQSVSGQFKGKASQIEFICGHDFLQLFKDYWSDFIFFQPDLLSAHLETLGKELESDANIHRLATAHGLNATAQKKNIYVEPALSQLQGKLSRGTTLPDPSYLYDISSLTELEKFRRIIESLITSLQVVDYLSPEFQKKRTRSEQQLQAWPDRFDKEWSSAQNRARTEALKLDRNAPAPIVPIPTRIVDEFLASESYQFLTDVYAELDREIYDANACLSSGTSRVDLLGSTFFAKYGSLLHASTVYYPTVQFASEGTIEWSPEELLKENRNIIVTGAPGFGKSSFCRNYFLGDLQKFKAGNVRVLPLYFAAHSILMTEGQSFEEIFIRHEVANKLATDDSIIVRVYLDGIDEVRSRDLRDRILMVVSDACIRKNSRYHCIATARDHVGGYWTSSFARVKLSPLSQEKLRELVTAWLDGDAEMTARFYSELGHSEALLPVLGVPLLATLTVLVFKNLHRLPENKLRLYQMFIDLLLGGWNLAKGLQRSSTYSSTIKLLILTRLAGMMHWDKTKECKESLLISTLKQVAPTLVPRVQSLIGELVEMAFCYLREDQAIHFHTYRFRNTWLRRMRLTQPGRKSDEW